MKIRTRYGKIRGKDLSDWRVWCDAAKNRYEEHGWWQTLDARLVARSFALWWPIGFVLRFILAVMGSNRYEPFPIGNRDSVNELWEGDPAWLRWFKWHLRNPWCDLRKFYFGFGYGLNRIRVEYWFGQIYWVRFAWLRFCFPFPEIETRFFVIGWQQRGILSARIKRV